MKTKTLVCGVVFIVVVVIVVVCVYSCASGNKMLAANVAMTKFEGIYVNTEYLGIEHEHPQKTVITSDGRIEDWALATNKKPRVTGEYKIVESWMDKEGNIYCTVDVVYMKIYFHQELWKLDNSGNVFEMNLQHCHGCEYPTEIDPNPDPMGFPTQHYNIYYRQ